MIKKSFLVKVFALITVFACSSGFLFAPKITAGGYKGASKAQIHAAGPGGDQSKNTYRGMIGTEIPSGAPQNIGGVSSRQRKAGHVGPLTPLYLGPPRASSEPPSSPRNSLADSTSSNDSAATAPAGLGGGSPLAPLSSGPSSVPPSSPTYSLPGSAALVDPVSVKTETTFVEEPFVGRRIGVPAGRLQQRSAGVTAETISSRPRNRPKKGKNQDDGPPMTAETLDSYSLQKLLAQTAEREGIADLKIDLVSDLGGPRSRKRRSERVDNGGTDLTGERDLFALQRDEDEGVFVHAPKLQTGSKSLRHPPASLRKENIMSDVDDEFELKMPGARTAKTPLKGKSPLQRAKSLEELPKLSDLSLVENDGKLTHFGARVGALTRELANFVGKKQFFVEKGKTKQETTLGNDQSRAVAAAFLAARVSGKKQDQMPNFVKELAKAQLTGSDKTNIDLAVDAILQANNAKNIIRDINPNEAQEFESRFNRILGTGRGRNHHDSTITELLGSASGDEAEVKAFAANVFKITTLDRTKVGNKQSVGTSRSSQTQKTKPAPLKMEVTNDDEA